MSTTNKSALDRFFFDELFLRSTHHQNGLCSQYLQMSSSTEEVDLSAWFDFERYEADLKLTEQQLAQEPTRGLLMPAKRVQVGIHLTLATPPPERSRSEPPSFKKSLCGPDMLRFQAFCGAHEDVLQRQAERLNRPLIVSAGANGINSGACERRRNSASSS